MVRHATATVLACAMMSAWSGADTIVDVDGAVRGFTHVEWHPSTRIMRRSHMGITTDPEHTVLAVGDGFACAISKGTADSATGGAHSHRPGELVCWGDGVRRLGTPPAGEFAQVTAGGNHACALRADQSLVCWGAIRMDKPGPFVQASSGTTHGCALHQDGTVLCYGKSPYGQRDVPPETHGILQVSAGDSHTCALKRDNTVLCWGSDASGQCRAPQNHQFRQVSASLAQHACAVDPEGELRCWGANSAGQALPGFHVDAPGDDAEAPQFARVAAGSWATCGILLDGEVTCWGGTEGGGATAIRKPPAGTFGLLSLGRRHACAVREDGEGASGADGEVVCWGDARGGVLDVPPRLRV